MSQGLAPERAARNAAASVAHLLVTLSLTIAVVVTSGAARGQPATPPAQPVALVRFTVTYEAPQGCPSREDFIKEIQARSRIAVLAGIGQAPAVVANVRLATERRGFRGELDLTSGLVSKERRLTSATCGEVVSALALVTALAIDPNAETRPIESLSKSTEIVSAPPVGPEAPPLQLGPPPPARVLEPWSREPDLNAAPLPSWVVRPAPGRARLRPRFSVQGAVLTFVSDEPLVGVDVSGGVTRGGDLPFEVEAGFTYLTTAAVIDGGALDGQLELLLGEVEGCVPGLFITRDLRLVPCLALTAGGARATLTNAAGDEASGVGPWVGLRPSAELDWRFGPPVGLDLQAGPTFPLLQTEFVNGSRTIVEGGPAGLWVALGLALEL